jgi:hypothetical protein
LRPLRTLRTLRTLGTSALQSSISSQTLAPLIPYSTSCAGRATWSENANRTTRTRGSLVTLISDLAYGCCVCTGSTDITLIAYMADVALQCAGTTIHTVRATGSAGAQLPGQSSGSTRSGGARHNAVGSAGSARPRQSSRSTGPGWAIGGWRACWADRSRQPHRSNTAWIACWAGSTRQANRPAWPSGPADTYCTLTT